MKASAFEPEEDNASPKGFPQDAERARQVKELISALQNFAEHFGPEEVYQQARAIYLATAEGRAVIDQDAAQIGRRGNAPREYNSPASERPRRAASSQRPRNESRQMEDARKALGG